MESTLYDGLTREELVPRLRAALEDGRYSSSALCDMVSQFGRREEQSLVREVTGSLS